MQLRHYIYIFKHIFKGVVVLALTKAIMFHGGFCGLSGINKYRPSTNNNNNTIVAMITN